MAQGHLRVTIVEAAKLVGKDKTDFNDPYVEVYIEKEQKQKTGTINNVERPVWNKTFDFNIWPRHEYIYIDVYDEDEGKEPDFIGSAKVSLDDVIEKGQFDNWIKLSGLFGFGNRGDIRIRMTFEKTSTD